MKDIRGFFIILIAGILIGGFAKSLESRQRLKFEIEDFTLHDKPQLSQIMDNNTFLFFERYNENIISRAFRFYNLNEKFDYDISRLYNDKNADDISFIKVTIGDEFFYLSRETANEKE